MAEIVDVCPFAYTEKQAAAYLAVSLSTLRRWRRTADGPEYFRFGGVLRYRQAALEAFIVANTHGDRNCS